MSQPSLIVTNEVRDLLATHPPDFLLWPTRPFSSPEFLCGEWQQEIGFVAMTSQNSNEAVYRDHRNGKYVHVTTNKGIFHFPADAELHKVATPIECCFENKPAPKHSWQGLWRLYYRLVGPLAVQETVQGGGPDSAAGRVFAFDPLDVPTIESYLSEPDEVHPDVKKFFRKPLVS